MKYYRILDDLDIKNRWFLGQVDFDEEDDFWKYISTGEVQNISKELNINIRKKGKALDITMADFELIIVNEKMVPFFNKQDVQLIPLSIKGVKSSSNYFLLVIKNELNCVDEQRSNFEIWEEGNDIRPDLAGQYSSFFKLAVDPNSIDNVDIFRIKNYNVAVIVNEKIKRIFEDNFDTAHESV